MPKKQYSPEEKLKIVLEALKEERLITDIASDYGIHHSVIHRWKRELLESADRIFAASKNAKAAAKEKWGFPDKLDTAKLAILPKSANY